MSNRFVDVPDSGVNVPSRTVFENSTQELEQKVARAFFAEIPV